MRRLRARLATPLVLVLLAAVATASTSGAVLYRIRSGDTLSGIAHHFHMSVHRLVGFNHLPGNGSLIYAGSTLRIPTGPPQPRALSQPPAPATTPANPTRRTVVSTYVVRPGDSLYAVAARFHASATRIAKWSQLPRSWMIRIGQRLRIPHDVVIAPRATSGPHPYLNTRIAAPSPQQMAAIIRAAARTWGVDPKLALAVAWQESGFDQRWVSATGAIGAMQVEPYTGVFISKYLVHRTLNLSDAHDNATAGVALLAIFMRETRGNAAKSVAGYYQGLASVQARGLYADTKRYVANVLALRNRF